MMQIFFPKLWPDFLNCPAAEEGKLQGKKFEKGNPVLLAAHLGTCPFSKTGKCNK